MAFPQRPDDLETAPPVAHTSGMGFNPHRPQKRTPADYVMVAAAMLACAALVAWAIFG